MCSCKVNYSYKTPDLGKALASWWLFVKYIVLFMGADMRVKETQHLSLDAKQIHNDSDVAEVKVPEEHSIKHWEYRAQAENG